MHIVLSGAFILAEQRKHPALRAPLYERGILFFVFIVIQRSQQKSPPQAGDLGGSQDSKERFVIY